MPEIQKSTPESLSIGEVYYLFFRHKWKILIFSFLGVVASVAVYFLTPAVYESEATLLVRYVSDTTILDPLSTGERITAPGRGGENVINSEIAILSSRDLVEKVMDAMGFGRFAVEFSNDPTNSLDRAKIAELVLSAIKIEAPKNSNIIRVAFDGPTPVFAQEFLRRLTESYLQKHIEIHRAAGAYEFLSQQTDQLRSRLSETEEELRKLKYSEGIVSLEDTKKNVSQRIEELTRGVDELETTLAAAKARAEVLRPLQYPGITNRTTIVRITPEVIDEAIFALKSRLIRLQQKEVELLASYKADSIPVKSLRDQIAETRLLLDGRKPAEVTNNVESIIPAATNYMPVILEAHANIAELQARITVQKELLSRALAEAKKVDAVETRIVQLQRNRELQESNYKYFCQSLEHARVDEALNSGRISNISIVQPATMPAAKIRVKLPQNMGIALLLGVVCGLGLAIVKEYFIDHTIRKPTELPTLLRIPLVMSLPRLKPRRLLLKGGKHRAGPLLLNPHGDATDSESKESVDEPVELMGLYDALRDRILTLIGNDSAAKPYILGITGCAKGSGVSTIAAGLALALARDGADSIILIDANAESGAPTIFGVNPTTGLVEMVPDGEGNTTVTQHHRYIVPSASSELKPVFSSPAHRFAALIQHLRNSKAGYVIVDMPPVTETGLTLRISRLLNGVLLVIPAEKVNRHVAEHAKEWLVQSDAKLIGTILNKRRQYVPDWLYSNC